jgi:hypothetical protein
MRTAASVSFAEMTYLMQQMPSYHTYRSLDEAATAERTFRHALGAMLKECGNRLLNVAERRSQILSSDQEAMLDNLVDRIAAIFRRLDREGAVCLVGDCEATISELEEIDIRLILLIEESLALVRNLGRNPQPTHWFQRQAPLLSRDLAAFSEATEERNYLLGLGWESEFTWHGRG